MGGVVLKRAPGAALLTAAALACGGGDPSGGSGGGQPDALPDRYERLCAARDRSPEPPRSLAVHLRLLGEIAFRSDDGEVAQEAELWVGGPARMRVVLRAERSKNVFLLEDAGHAWLRSGQESGFSPYPAEELAAEAWLRWQVLRFPWGWRERVAAAPRAKAWTRPSPFGPATVTVDAQERPVRARAGEVTVAVGDWRLSTGGALLPARWDWEAPAGRRQDRWSRMEDGTVFLDVAFRPGQGDADGAEVLRPDPASAPVEAEESLQVIRSSLRWLEAEDAAALTGPPPPGSWWRVAGARRYVLAGDAAAPPELEDRIVSTPPRRWLHWVSYRALSAEEARRQLRAAAAGAGLEADGPVWMRETPPDAAARRRDHLLPLR